MHRNLMYQSLMLKQQTLQKVLADPSLAYLISNPSSLNSYLNVSGLSIFNNGLSLYNNSNYINFQTGILNNSYSINFPSLIGLVNNTLSIDSVSNNTVYLNWYNPLDIIVRQTYIKLGDQKVETILVSWL